MADYQSSHSGQEIDTVVTTVLNGTSGIQGVKLNGVDITPDSSNKVNISTASFFTAGSFVPSLVCVGTTPTDPNYTGTISGSYYLIDKLCYINFYMDLTVTSRGVGSYQISSLPFTSTNSAECAITLNAFNLSDNVLYDPTITMHTVPGTSNIQIERANGRMTVDASSAPSSTFNMEIGGSGFYIIS